jgi:hypothetical protein
VHRNSDGIIRLGVVGEVLLALGEARRVSGGSTGAVDDKDTSTGIGSPPWHQRYRDLPGWKAIEARISIPR